MTEITTPDKCPLCGFEGFALPHDRVALFPGDLMILVDGKAINVTRSEMDILTLLYKRSPRLVSFESFYASLYGHLQDPPGNSNLRIHVANIRRKLKGSTLALETVRSGGYKLVLKG